MSEPSAFNFSYPDAPQITRVQGCNDTGALTIDCPTSALDSNGQVVKLTITGSRFSEPDVIRVGLADCENIVITIPDQQVTCDLPVGEWALMRWCHALM